MYHWVDYFSFEAEINRAKRKIKLDRIKRQKSRNSRIDRDNKEIDMFDSFLNNDNFVVDEERFKRICESHESVREKIDRINRELRMADRLNRKEIEMKNTQIDGYNGIYYHNYSNHSDWVKAINASCESIKEEDDKECINNILCEITDDMGSAAIRIINAIIDDLGDEEKEFVNNTMKKHPRFNPIYHYVYGRLSYKTYRIEPEFFGNEIVDGIRRVIRSYISE